jgi:hypothetical protein
MDEAASAARRCRSRGRQSAASQLQLNLRDKRLALCISQSVDLQVAHKSGVNTALELISAHGDAKLPDLTGWWPS